MNKADKVFFDKATIIIFTAHFPFENGEEFLHDEMKILSEKKIDTVIISVSKTQSKTLWLSKSIMCINAAKKTKLFITIYKTLQYLPKLLYCKKHHLNYNIFKIMILTFGYNRIDQRLKKFYQSNNIVIKNKVIYSYWMSGLAYHSLRLKNKNYLVTRAHSYEAYPNLFFQPYRKEIYNSMDKIYFISQQTKYIALENAHKYGIALENKTQVSHLGIKNEAKKPNFISIKKPQKINIVSCSSVNYNKRLDLIIDSLSIIKDIEISWTHFGGGYLLSDVKDYAFKMLKSNVKYSLNGHSSREIIYNYYEKNHIDFFINFSDHEGIPVSIMEAFMFSIPAIARRNNSGAIREIVQDRENGFMIDDEKNALKDVFKRYLSFNLGGVNSMRIKAYNSYIAKFDADNNYNIFYNNLMDSLKNEI